MHTVCPNICHGYCDSILHRLTEEQPVIERLCKSCGKKIKTYSSLQNRCFDCTKRAYRPIAKKGRETRLYETFRDKVAKPYLDNKYGHICAVRGCEVTEGLEVDHKKTRGAHHELKFDVKNLQYLCFTHHRLKTDGKMRV